MPELMAGPFVYATWVALEPFLRHTDRCQKRLTPVEGLSRERECDCGLVDLLMAFERERLLGDRAR